MFHNGTEATCQTKGKCSVCGYEYYGEHNIAVSNYVYIDEMRCGSYCATEGCDYLSEWSYHTGGTSDCQHKSICEICHSEYGSFGDHVTVAEWSADAESHWHECELCEGQRLDGADHADTDGDGKCDDCGYPMPSTDPGNENETDEKGEKDTDTDSSEEDQSGDGVQGGCASGCGSFMGGGFAAMLISTLAGAWLVIKKKEK